MNPEGILAQSPGLRGTSYPGSPGRGSTTPKGLRLCGAKMTQPRWGWMRCALGPRVARCLATLGWQTQSRWDCRSGRFPAIRSSSPARVISERH